MSKEGQGQNVFILCGDEHVLPLETCTS